ncbi:sigma-70 family RNA polymerase sigma factor [Luteolibacter ambystomatis]|uniref:Sigma-70 family RNA polymerase sigma factor n=1 Tax=Luteolibacter ambystomatis TaxID=2824561 RepID=A0A975PFU5_9BACT|nr:sigma-70 family RNA polymerase sigma factor [Luteolibacter ambystomatis]QUE52239.1 sigma-70 family RNA polymerase sigma factor [Luteolibacter ambystomatis]
MTESATRVERAVSTAEFEELLISHQRRLFLYIKSLVTNYHQAEDLLQRTNLILWRKRTNFEAGSNFHAWSFAIARFEALSQLRQLRRDKRVFADLDEDIEDIECPLPIYPDYPDPDAAALSALKDCLKRLPARDQELVMMRYGTDKTLGDYAKDLNRKPGTLKARLFKIRENLRKGIEAELLKIDGEWVESYGSSIIVGAMGPPEIRW